MLNFNRNNKGLAGISYLGLAGISSSCLKAIMSILVFGDDIRNATIVTSNYTHCFLLEVETYDFVAVKSGFSSGYAGEGPSALELVLRLLYQRQVPIREVFVDAELINRLDMSSLTSVDVKYILDDKNFRRGSQWIDYMERNGAKHPLNFGIWRSFPDVIPYAQIDLRIYDIALQFSFEPDVALLNGYRRLEGFVKKRTGLTESGSKLFAQAFQGNSPKLTWTSVDQAEINGRGSLFSAAYMAFRNPRAHKEPGKDSSWDFSEFMILNTLFRLEAQATEK
jgi:hypothetical protein